MSNSPNRQITSYELREKTHQYLEEWDKEVEDQIITKAKKIIKASEILELGQDKKKLSKDVRKQANDIIDLLGGRE